MWKGRPCKRPDAGSFSEALAKLFKGSVGYSNSSLVDLVPKKMLLKLKKEVNLLTVARAIPKLIFMRMEVSGCIFLL